MIGEAIVAGRARLDLKTDYREMRGTTGKAYARQRFFDASRSAEAGRGRNAPPQVGRFRLYSSHGDGRNPHYVEANRGGKGGRAPHHANLLHNFPSLLVGSSDWTTAAYAKVEISLACQVEEASHSSTRSATGRRRLLGRRCESVVLST